MKLCRFELKSDPGSIKSGIVYGGKVYETDGANPIGVHEAQDVRPLSPVPTPPSLRFFPVEALDTIEAGEDLPYFYGNPASLAGPSQIINAPITSSELVIESYFAAVLVSSGYQLSIEQIDGFILGYTLMNVLVAKDVEKRDRRLGFIGRSHDIGANIGPVITTPDEIEDSANPGEFGPKFTLTAIARTNGVDKASVSLDSLPKSLHEAIASASRSCTLKAGDVVAIGPIFDNESTTVTLDDEFQIAVEHLGTLSTKVGTETDSE